MPRRCFYADDVLRDWSSYRSGGPSSLNELREAPSLILGHMSSSTFLPSIITKGLAPDTGRERASKDQLYSDPDCVYLLTRFDRFYLNRATQSHGGEPIILEVQAKRSRLVADENALSPARMKDVDQDTALYESMCFGACKHRGPIPPEHILGIFNADGKRLFP